MRNAIRYDTTKIEGSCSLQPHSLLHHHRQQLLPLRERQEVFVLDRTSSSFPASPSRQEQKQSVSQCCCYNYRERSNCLRAAVAPTITVTPSTLRIQYQEVFALHSTSSISSRRPEQKAIPVDCSAYDKAPAACRRSPATVLYHHAIVGIVVVVGIARLYNATCDTGLCGDIFRSLVWSVQG